MLIEFPWIRKTDQHLFLKKDFLFQVHPVLKNCNGELLKHFENSVWLILSDGTIPGEQKYTLEELDAACFDALKSFVAGFGNTEFSVRPGTNDYQVVKEVVDTYFPDISKWLNENKFLHRKRVVDIGGHIGSFSIQVNKLLKENCDIHVYEPEPSNFDQIGINLNQNKANNITPFNLAVSSKAGESVIAFNVENTGGHQLGASGLSYKAKTIPVEVVTLESVFSKWDSMPIDILKIDVEGSEYNALFPAPELVKQCRLIVGEAQRSKDHVPQDMIDFLKAQGFNVTYKGDPQNVITFSAVNHNV